MPHIRFPKFTYEYEKYLGNWGIDGELLIIISFQDYSLPAATAGKDPNSFSKSIEKLIISSFPHTKTTSIS